MLIITRRSQKETSRTSSPSAVISVDICFMTEQDAAVVAVLE